MALQAELQEQERARREEREGSAQWEAKQAEELARCPAADAEAHMSDGLRGGHGLYSVGCAVVVAVS